MMTDPKTILITGANSGIGRGLAFAYAKSDVILCLTGRDKTRLAEVVHLCEKKGATVHSASIDVTDKQRMFQWVQACDDIRPLDVVIANAGVSSSSIGESEGQDALKTQQMVFDVNLQGTLNTIFPILPRMQQRRSGHIVLMSSMASFRGLPRSPAYAASKAAIKVYGEAMGARWAKAGINFSVICPGFIQTPLTDKNKYSMPFKMTLDVAIKRMVTGIQKRKPFIPFPWPMHVVCYILSILPTQLAQLIMNYIAG